MQVSQAKINNWIFKDKKLKLKGELNFVKGEGTIDPPTNGKKLS